MPKKIISIILFICLLLALYLFARRSFYIYHGLLPNISYIGSFLGAHLENNEGRFFQSEDELIDKKIIKKEYTYEHKVEYYGRSINHNQDKWYHLAFFELLDLAYGISVENLYVNGNKLMNKETGEEVLLIKGPYEEELYSLYNSISLNWYKIMIDTQENMLQED